MTELNEEIIQEETDESVESSDDIFGMIGNKPEQLKSDKKEIKKNEAKKDQEKEIKKEPKKSYKFPFQIYFAGTNHDMTGAFEENREYSTKQITDIMLANHFYEFAGAVDYDYIQETNTLVAMFMQHKKG